MTDAGATVTGTSAVDGWPYVAIDRENRKVTMCIATVDLPPAK
jgi:hypothetical protein